MIVAVEARRLLSRRLVRILMILFAGAILVAGIATFFKTSAAPPDVDAGARARFEETMRSCLVGEFGAPPNVYGSSPDDPVRREFCDKQVPPPERFVQDRRFRLTSLLEITQGVSALLIIATLLIGASFMGAEWHNRTVTTQLTWEPRRVRLLLAKALALAGVVFALSMILQWLFVSVFLPAAFLHGDTAGAGGAWWRSLIGSTLRVGAIASVAAVLGFAIGVIGRNTAAALGAGFLYFAVLERILSGVRPGWVAWFLGDNAVIFISGHGADFAPGRTTTGALLIVLIYVGAILAAATALFRRQDVG